jgi:hypothetical protein
VKAGVVVFIDLTTSADGLKPYLDIVNSIDRTIECCTFPIPDVSVPGSRQTTRDILDLIDNSLAQGKGIYLHCWGGIGRTGTIVGCWLARHGFAGRAAWEKLSSLWRWCPKSRYRQSPKQSNSGTTFCPGMKMRPMLITTPFSPAPRAASWGNSQEIPWGA